MNTYSPPRTHGDTSLHILIAAIAPKHGGAYREAACLPLIAAAPLRRQPTTACVRPQPLLREAIRRGRKLEGRNRIQHRTGSARDSDGGGSHQEIPAISLGSLFTYRLKIQVVENGHSHGYEHQGVDRLSQSLQYPTDERLRRRRCRESPHRADAAISRKLYRALPVP